MIWKLLFIGFVLSNNRTNKILLLNSMPRNELSKRQRSNSEDINTTNETIGEIYNKSQELDFIPEEKNPPHSFIFLQSLHSVAYSFFQSLIDFL
jgi:hypothetical protein